MCTHVRVEAKMISGRHTGARTCIATAAYASAVYDRLYRQRRTYEPGGGW